MKLSKVAVFFLVLSLILSPLASFPVEATNPNDPDGDDDNDEDGYDANRDGEISDEEMFTNLEEYRNKTNPNEKDTDGGGAWDGWEVYYNFNPKDSSDESADNDTDSLINSIEFYWDTDPFDSDTDQDGMPDGWEDTYSDRLPDGCGLDPTDSSDKFGDPDADGSDNLREYQEDTNPCNEDSDGDGDLDGEDPPPVEPGDPPGTKPDTGETDGNVTIYEIFDPVLGSLKRWSSLDALHYDSSSDDPYTMYNFDTTKVEIFPTNYEGYSQIFEGWIWMGISVTDSQYTMIPSVSPDAEIIDYDPNATDVEIRFFKDGADNYFIQGNKDATIDLKYRMGTNGSYFNRPISEDLTISDLPEESIRTINGASEVKENVKDLLQYRHDNGTIANEPLYWLWPEDGDPETNLAAIINNLTWYFSAFIEGDGDVPDPEPPWDVYQSICINGIGACRHRSFGFFVTALALGAPTRYVSNEAHAFVEVYVPEDNETFSASHWKRINLGGTGSSNTLDRPDEGEEEGDTFDFDGMDPGDIDNMTGEQVTIVIETVSPTDKVEKGESVRVQGYVEDQNNTRLSNFQVGLGMWDKNHIGPAFEIGQGLTDSSGNFDINATDFLAAILGGNEIYAASYKQGFLGIDGPEDIDIHSDAVLVVDAPPSVGKGQDLVISGALKDIGDVPIVGETIEFEVWEGNSKASVRCPPTRSWHRYRCDIGTAETDEFGNFVFSWLVPEEGEPAKDDDYHTESLFRGSAYTSNADPDNDNLNVVSTIDLIILDSSVDLTASIEPAEEYIGGTFWINGTISAEAIDNGNITIEIAGSEIEDIEVTEATWSISLEVPSSLSAGNYTVIVKFVSSNILLPDERVNLNLTVLGNSKIEIDIASQKVTRGQSVSLEGELVDHLGEPLADEEITIKWDNVQIAKVTTEIDGDFVFDYLVPSMHNLGNTSWSAEFTGNSLHSGSSESQSSVVFQQTVIVIQTNKSHFYSGESMTINGSLEMDNGTLLSGILAFYFDNLYLESFNTNGNYSFEYTPDSSYIDVGQHQLEIRYSEKDYNLESESTTEVFLHRKVFLTIDEQQVLRDQEIEITGFARDESSFGIPELRLSFVWGDNTLSDQSETDFGGSYSRDFQIPNYHKLGPVSVKVIFDNTTQPFYDNATSEVDFVVWSETLINLPDVEITRGSSVWFNGTIFDDRGQPDDDIEVNIFWGDEYLERVIGDENGIFSFECESDKSCSDLDHPAGIVPVRLSFGGYGYYRPSEYIANYTIWGNTEINITSFSDIILSGDNVTFSGFVNNDLGIPLDREISILWDDMPRTKVTSINGDFNGSFVLSHNMVVGNHTLSVSTSDQNFLRGSSDEVKVLVMRNTDLTIQNLVGFRNSTSLVSGHLRDTGGEGLSGLQLDLYFDDSFVGNVTTGDSGIFSYYLFLDKDTNLGPHDVRLTFTGSYLYKESTEEISIDVMSYTLFEFENIEVFRLQEFQVTSKLIDDLGNPIINQQVNMSFGENQYSLISDSNGFVEKLLTLPVSYDLGIYSISWDYNGDLYYLANSQSQKLTVVSSTFINVESKAEVLVGESFIFSGSIVDDMESPLNTSLGFYFDGKYVDTLWTDENGSFYNEYTVPVETKAGPNMLTIQYVSNDFYLASSFNWQLQVYHDIRIETGEFEGILNSSASISGVVYDKANRTVDDLEIRMFFDGYSLPVDTITDSQGIFTFTLDMPFGTELGYHQLNFIFAGNNYYISNSTTSTIFVMGETIITIEVPSSLEYSQNYVGSIRMTMLDGTPVSNESLLVTLEPESVTFMVVTDVNGNVTFESTFMGNSTTPVEVEVKYEGGGHYLGSEVATTIIYRAPIEKSYYELWVIFAAATVGLSGLSLGWKWYRDRHLREIQRILESTALALEANMDYRDSIVNSYKEMCKSLQGYGYLRRHFETVREFQQALLQALSLDHDSITRLTTLYEAADYATDEIKDEQRLNAVSALRTVIDSLDSNEEQNIN